MLIINGVGCHTNEKFMRVCYSKNILPFQLPSHTTYLFQPLNVIYFQPLKHYHSETINKTIYNNNYKFSKIKFLAQITSICLQVFKKNNISEFFRKIRLILFNLKIVMQKLQDLLSPTTKFNLPAAPFILS